MNNFEKLCPTKQTCWYRVEHCFDVTLSDFEQTINNDFIQLEAEWLNNINYFSRESNKFGIIWTNVNIQVEYFQFEYYCAFTNTIKILLFDFLKGFIMHNLQNPR